MESLLPDTTSLMVLLFDFEEYVFYGITLLKNFSFSR